MPRLLILLGALLILIGLFWGFFSKMPLGRLPGDIAIHKKNFTFYFPLATSLLVSAVLSLILWLISKK
ncbi:MAG: DUF2905 domain-containing protein [Candidatus Omnitrophota bacterium]